MAGRGALAKAAASTFLRINQIHRYSRRTFLSDDYRCQDAWKNRSSSPLLEKLKFDNMYVDLMKKLQNEGKVSAIDVDLCVQLVGDASQMSNLEKLVNKFRRCPNTVHTLPSTQHAVIRSFLEHKQTDTLMRMVDDRLNYGLFPDYYLSNLLMDTFLKEENFRDAVKVAIQLMLQEEYENPISNQMSLYSCYAYLRKPQPELWDPQPRSKPEEPKEVVKVRVDYIREPYFDDHFDLTEANHLVGKTLVGLGKRCEGPVGSTSVLLGWTMFEKYDKVLDYLDRVLLSPTKPLIYKEWITQCQNLVQESTQLPEQFAEQFSNRLHRMESEGFLLDGDILEVIRHTTAKVLEQHEKSDIERQLANYIRWEERRQAELEKEISNLERQKRLAILEAKKKELQEKEELLHFFDNIDEWELRFEEKEEARRQREEEESKKGKTISAKQLRQAEEDSYVPPEVQKKHAT